MVRWIADKIVYCSFDRDLLSGKNICSSEGIFVNFPPLTEETFPNERAGAVIATEGNFQFSLNQKKHFAGAGESLFIPEDGEFQVLQESGRLEVRILIYQIEPIRDIMGESGWFPCICIPCLTPEEPSCVWSTGEEEGDRKVYVLIGQCVTVGRKFI